MFILFSENYDVNAELPENLFSFENINVNSGWLEEIIKSVKINPKNKIGKATDNAYHAPEMIKTFCDLLSNIVFWSNIMCEAFESDEDKGTTQDVESNFKTLKHHVVTKKMRADKFVMTHLDYIKKELKLSFAEANSKKQLRENLKKRKRSNSLNTRVESPGKLFRTF